MRYDEEGGSVKGKGRCLESFNFGEFKNTPAGSFFHGTPRKPKIKRMGERLGLLMGGGNIYSNQCADRRSRLCAGLFKRLLPARKGRRIRRGRPLLLYLAGARRKGTGEYCLYPQAMQESEFKDYRYMETLSRVSITRCNIHNRHYKGGFWGGKEGEKEEKVRNLAGKRKKNQRIMYVSRKT